MTSRSAGRPPRVLSPHMTASSPELEGQMVSVGGRVLRDGPRAQIADAFCALDVDFLDAAPDHGSIAVIEGKLQGPPGARRLTVAIASFVQTSSRESVLSPEFERVALAGVGRRLQTRARVLELVRSFFRDAGFLEVDTPLRSQECSPEPNIEPLTCSGGYLITSPELHMKRLLVAGVPQSFQIVHCFRAEELGPLHSPEFSLLEWYRAFADYHIVMEDTEQLIHHLCRELHSADELTLPSGARVDLTPPFERCSVRDAFARHAGVMDAAALAERDEDRYFQLLVDRVEPALAGRERPVFLYEYPASQAALARRCPHDPSVAERFELYLGGVELCNGYGELTDAVEQRGRSELERTRRNVMGRHVPPTPSLFLAALEHGMPPASGNALGLDRLIALLCGEARIDAVCPFPDVIA